MDDAERQHTMDFILRQQAQTAADMQRNEGEHARFNKSLKQVGSTLALLAWQFRRERKDLNERMAALIDAQLRTEEALRSLAATTERNSIDIATLAKAGKTTGEDRGGSTPS
ncbi:MAG TPA: hypothetical protein VF591_07440 [Pyrinomonadaceae bacterium]|jgi:hypothetical protein